MKWNKFPEQIPFCWSQHRDVFVSSQLLVKCEDDDEYCVDRYFEQVVFTENGSDLIDQGFQTYKNVTHWVEISHPTI